LPTLRREQLSALSSGLLKAAGASDEEAEIVTRNLVKANLVGADSHGILQLISYVNGIRSGVIKPGARFEVTKESPSTALTNGNWGFGQVVCSKAMKLAISKAQKVGSAVVCVFNCNHIGRLADYTQMALESDMIGFICVNGDSAVAPYGGKKAMLSTNPLSYGIPAGKENPIILDIATAIVAEGKVRAALYKGEKLPPGWILDSSGKPSTSPADLYQPPLPPAQAKISGAIQPAAGHKGYGLGLVVAILTGALTGTLCDPEIISGLTNTVYINVIKIDEFVALQDFKNRVDRLVRTIKDSPKAEGFNEILIPGEAEVIEEEKRTKSGVTIPDFTWNALTKLCNEYGFDAEKLLDD